MKLIALLSSILSTTLFASIEKLEVGKPIPKIVLKDEDGGKLDGSAWSSDQLKGKVYSIFYVDPDERKLNEPLEAAYKKEALPKGQHQGVAIINMAATWLPNSMIDVSLKKKQEEFPNSIYVRDNTKTLVLKAWGLADDAVNVVIVDRDGIVRFLSRKPVEEKEFESLFKTIRSLFDK